MASVCHDLVILGGGPAGLTAGLYAARSRMDVVLLEGKACGGQLMTYESVENYPGFPEGIGASELVEKMVAQATRFGLKIEREQAISVKVSPDQKEKTVVLKNGEIRCKSIVVATGAHERKIAVDGEERLRSKGVSYCATCDGAFFEDCIISVVGGGDMAVEEGIYLTRFGKRVNIIHRRNESPGHEGDPGEGVCQPQDQVHLGHRRDQGEWGGSGRKRHPEEREERGGIQSGHRRPFRVRRDAALLGVYERRRRRGQGRVHHRKPGDGDERARDLRGRGRGEQAVAPDLGLGR